jgi:hypothetical protein
MTNTMLKKGRTQKQKSMPNKEFVKSLRSLSVSVSSKKIKSINKLFSSLVKFYYLK